MRKMTTVSTSLFPVSASGIQIRLLYGYGNGNENRSFLHYGNKKVPSLVLCVAPSTEALCRVERCMLCNKPYFGHFSRFLTKRTLSALFQWTVQFEWQVSWSTPIQCCCHWRSRHSRWCRLLPLRNGGGSKERLLTLQAAVAFLKDCPYLTASVWAHFLRTDKRV